ncbi:MAG: PAS domain-containing protein, partial [Acidimicrobiales bacterium]
MTTTALIRDKVRAGARHFRRLTLDLSEAGFIGPLFFQRYVAIIALSVVARLFIDSPDHLPYLILGMGLSTNVAAHLFARRTGVVPVWMHLLDMGAVVVVPLFDDRTVLPVLLVMLTIVSLAASLSGVGTAVLTTAEGTAGLIILHVGGVLDRTGLTTASFAVTGAMIAVAVGHLANIEEQIRSRLNLVVDNLDAILWVRDPVDGRFMFVNQRGATLLGWSEEQWLTAGFWDTNLHPDDHDATTEAVARAVALGIEYEAGYRFRAADGRWVHLHDRVTVTV